MSGNSDIVYFEMPDGTKVSNDPRFDMDEAMEEIQSSVEYSGDAGIPHEEQKAQTQVEHMDPLQSGQPGVGENAVPSLEQLIGNTGTPAMQRQKEDLAEAQAAGADPMNTSVNDPEPVDSNAAVKAVREATQEQREAYQKAMEKLGSDGVGDPDEPKSEWSVAQLRMEVAARNTDPNRAEEDLIDVSGAKKKSDLVKALEEDDAKSSTPGA